MLNDDVLQLFQRQHGLASTDQICGIEPARGRRRTIYKDPALVRQTSRVIRHLAAPTTHEQRLMLGVLDAGDDAVLWGKTAAHHWGFGRFRHQPVHVAIPRRTVRAGDEAPRQLHVLRHLDERDRSMHMDVPTARPETVILWLAGMWTHRLGHEAALERTSIALDQAWRQRLIDGRFLHDLVQRSAGSGRSGVVVMRRVLETRPSSYTPAGSRLEERFESILPERIRCQLDRQVTVDTDPVIRTVDYRLSTWPLIVEINSEVFHSSISDRAADDERYERLQQLGFSVIVFWEYDIWHDPTVVSQSMWRLVDKQDATPTLHRPTPAPWDH